MAISQQCPHCETQAVVADSRKVTRLVRDIYFRCTNIHCGATFKSQLAVVSMISPSAIPNPDVRLPLVPAHRRRGKITPANDDEPVAANAAEA